MSGSLVSSNVKLKPPDRKLLETTLRSLHAQIEKTRTQLKTILGDRQTGQMGDLVIVRGEIFQHRRELRELSRQSNEELRKKIVELDEKIKRKKSEENKLRQELSYTDWAHLKEALKNAEHQFQSTTFKNIKEENQMVHQIDALRRNERRLPEYDKLKSECRTMRQEKCELEKQRKDVYQKISELRRNLDKVLKPRNEELKKSIGTFKSELTTLHDRKRELVTKYDSDKTDYLAWRKNSPEKIQSNLSSSGGSFKWNLGRGSAFKLGSSQPNGAMFQLHDCSDTDSEGDELEAFSEEKRMCQNLIGYLDRFLLTADSKESSPERGNVGQDVPDATTKDPEGFTILRRKDDTELNNNLLATVSPKHRKRSSKRDRRKGNQSIPHHSEIFAQFSHLDIAVPYNYADVPAAIEALQEKIRYFAAHTFLPGDDWWDQDLYGFGATSYQASEASELTNDSAVAWSFSASISDVDLTQLSLTDGSLPPSGFQSPTTGLFGGQDEGIESKVSSHTSGVAPVEVSEVLERLRLKGDDSKMEGTED